MLILKPSESGGEGYCHYPGEDESREGHYIPTNLFALLEPFCGQWIEVRLVKGTRFRFESNHYDNSNKSTYTFVDTKSASSIWGCTSKINKTISKKQKTFRTGKTYDLHIKPKGGDLNEP